MIPIKNKVHKSQDTYLSTSRSISADSGGLANVLVVTTTMRMFNRVHGHTTDFRPAIAFGLVLVVGTTCLQDGLVDTATPSHNADHSTVGRWHDLLGTRRQLDSGPLGVWVVADDCAEVAAGPGQLATVTGLFFDAAHNGTLRHRPDGQDVANLKNSFLATVNKLPGVHALSGDEGLGLDLVLVGVPESHLCQGGSTAWVMDDILDHPLDVAMTLSKINWTQRRLAFPGAGVGLENGPRTFSLCANHSPHFF